LSYLKTGEERSVADAERKPKRTFDLATPQARKNLRQYDFSSDSGIRPCEADGCKIIVLLPRLFCRRHWKALRLDHQERIVRAVIDRNMVGLREVVEGAVTWIAGTIDRLED
jgi:hypothetical protein